MPVGHVTVKMAATLRNALLKRFTSNTKYVLTDFIRADERLQQVRNNSKNSFTFSRLSPPLHQRQNQKSECSGNKNLDLRNSVLRQSQYRGYSTNSDRNCWKCGDNTRTYEELFFCKCGIVQKLPDNLTYFEMLNSDEQFDIDTERLSQIYKDLQSRLHPDRFTLKSQTEQDLAVKQSTFVNNAYFTLLKPLSRGLYLLEVWGDPLEESTSMLDQEFLMDMMETNEDVDAAKSDLIELKTLEDINNAKMEECVKNVSEHFCSNQISDAKLSLIRLRYFTNISDKIKDIYRNHM